MYGDFTLSNSGHLTAPSTAPSSPWSSSSDNGDSYFTSLPPVSEMGPLDDYDDAKDYVMVIGGLGYIG